MAKQISVQVISNKNDVLNALSQQTKNALFAMGESAEGYAKDILTETVYSQTDISWDLTGRLRNSIAHAEDDTATYVGTNVEYAEGIETGSHRRKGAVHYLQKSLSEHVDEYKNILRDALES